MDQNSEKKGIISKRSHQNKKQTKKHNAVHTSKKASLFQSDGQKEFAKQLKKSNMKTLFGETSRKKLNKTDRSMNRSLQYSRKNTFASPEQKRLKTSAEYSKEVRKKNQKMLSHQSSHKNLMETRLPWGVNQNKLSNYVMQTLTKMQHIRNEALKQQHALQESIKKIEKNSSCQISIPKKTPSKILKKKEQKEPRQERFEDQERTEKKSTNKSQFEKNYHQKMDLQKLVINGYKGEFQNIEKNGFLQVNFRIMKNRIIELEIVILKKIDSLSLILHKNSLVCQSIQENYKGLSPKTSIFLMIAIQGCNNDQKFVYPEIFINISQRNGTFGLQKHICLPFHWLNLIQPLTDTEIKHQKTNSPLKIKNKSFIEGLKFQKKYIEILLKIFNRRYLKISKHKQVSYHFCFKYMQEMNHLRLILNVSENRFTLECETTNSQNPIEILKSFQELLSV